MIITSLNNKQVMYACSLKEKKYREKEGKYLIEGDHLIEMANLNDIECIFTTDTNFKASYPIYYVSDKVLEKISFTKWCPRLTVLTLILLVLGGIYFSQNGFNLGIDFKGGSSISLSSSSELSVEEVRKDIEELGYSIDKIESIDENSIYLTVSDIFEAKDNDKVETYFAEKYEDTTTSIGAVSNIVKKQLLENAIKSLIYACIGLIIYVSLRFTFSYGISSIVALTHDVLVVVICFSIFKLEVTTIFIAAILSIVGYSINNTIVTFDRARENKEKLYKNKIKSLEELKKQNIVLHFEVENVGEYDGSIVLCLYIHDKQASTVQRVRELKAFSKIALKKGEAKKGSLVLTKEDISVWNIQMQRVAEVGEIELYLNEGERDIWNKTIRIIE